MRGHNTRSCLVPCVHLFRCRNEIHVNRKSIFCVECVQPQCNQTAQRDLQVNSMKKQQLQSGTPENDRGSAPLPFHRGATRVKVPFYKSIKGNFMVYQDRIETNLLQLLAHPEISGWFCKIPGGIFEVNIVAEQK